MLNSFTKYYKLLILGNYIGNQDAAMSDTSIPQVVKGLNGHKIVDIAAGCEFVIALDSEQNVWSWGTNTEGQLGLGNLHPKIIPCMVNSLSGKNLARLAAGILVLPSIGRKLAGFAKQLFLGILKGPFTGLVLVEKISLILINVSLLSPVHLSTIIYHSAQG